MPIPLLPTPRHPTILSQNRLRRRRAFTLLELLVTMVSGCVVLIGLASLLSSMVLDQREGTFGREGYYSRARCNMELTWTMRQVSRAGLRQLPADVTAASIGSGPTLADGRGARGVITWNRDSYNQTEPAPQLPANSGASAPVDNNLRYTGCIFLFYNTLYKFECPLSQASTALVGAGGSFNAMNAGALAAWMQVPAHLQLCTILGTSVEQFDVTYDDQWDDVPGVADDVDPSVRYSVRWNLSVAR